MSIGESTVLYLFVFLLTCLFTDHADRTFEIDRRTAYYYSAIAIFIPSLLAGVRADTVGKDVLEYAVRTFELANSSSSFANMKELTTEPLGYSLLAYITSRFFDDTGYFLFASQLFVVAPVYIVAYKFRRRYPMWMTMCAYLFLFYNNSFNIMKQSVSSALILLFYCYLKEHKTFKAIICFLLAISFHSSAMFGLAFILIAFFLRSNRDKQTKITFAVICALLLMNLQGISNFLLSNSLLPEKYTKNITAVFDMSTHVYLRIVGFNKHVFFDWVYRVLIVILPIHYTQKAEKKVDGNVKVLALIGLAFYTYVLAKFKTVYGGRISIYCDFFTILLVPALTKAFRRDTPYNKTAANCCVVAFMGIYWFVWVMIYGWSASNYFSFRF